MATNAPAGAAAVSKKIIVTRIPDNVSSDKLTIYFQKRRNVGGGDVHSITFPVSNEQKDTAIITFEEPETVQSVLRNTHKIGGNTIIVRQLQPEPQIFDGASARLSDYVVQKLSENGGDLGAKLGDIMDCTGAVIRPEGQDYVVGGEWYQIQAVFARLETLILGKTDGSSSNPKSDYMSRSLMSSPTPVTPAAAPRQKPQAQEDVSITLDKDMFGYMQMNHEADLNAIKTRHDVNFKVTEIGEASQIDITSKVGDSNLTAAKDKLKDLYDSVSKSVVQDVVDLSAGLSSDSVDAIFAALEPEFPKVHMARLYSDPNKVMITAPDSRICKICVDSFRDYIKRYEPSSTTEHDKATDEDDDKNRLISVDKDIAGYIKLNRRSNMDRIWDENGAKITEEIVGDCLNIRVMRNPNAQKPFNLKGAISEFQKLYNFTNDKVAQKNYDTREVKGKLDKQKLAEALRMITTFYKDVYVSPMLGSNSHFILFIAADAALCEKAVELFGKLLNGS